MKKKFSLLGRTEYQLTDKLTIHIPLISELRSSYEIETEYYKLISLFVKTPCDAMVELDDIGIDYTQVKEYDLFIMLFSGLLSSKQDINLNIWKMILTKLKFKTIYKVIN